jgi:hypothetical protein
MVRAIVRHLSSPNSNVQSLSASCLLQCLNTASSETLRSVYPDVLKIGSRLLVSIESSGVMASRSVSKTRRVSSYLRLLQALLSRLRPLPIDIIQSAVDIFARFLYHGLGFTATPGSGALPDRSKLATAGAFSFGLPSGRAGGSRTQRGRSNTLKSDYGTSASESEDEAGPSDTLYVMVAAEGNSQLNIAFRLNARSQVRMDAVGCLETIAQVRRVHL